MFNIMFTEEDKALIALAKDFATEYINEESVAQWCFDEGIPDDVMMAYKDCGLGFLGLPTEYGGRESSNLAQIAVIEELSRVAGAMLPFGVQLYTFEALSLLADERQMGVLVDSFNETARVFYSTAISDSLSGSDILGSKTAVVQRDGVLYLSGRKAFVSEGEHAPYIMVMAKDMTECDNHVEAPISLWLLPRDTDGISVFPINKIGQKIISSAAIIFDDCIVKPEWRLGFESVTGGKIDMSTLLKTLEFGRCVLCASSLGLAQAALEDAAKYASTHTIRETRLAEFEMIAALLTEMQSTVLNMRGHVYHSAQKLDRGGSSMLETSLMKYYVPSAAVKVADSAMQIFGGVAYTDATRIGRIWSDCRGNQFAIGTEQLMSIIAGREVINKYSE